MMKVDKNYFAGKKVTVMGLGVHGGGLGNIKWLSEQGACVTVTDLRTERELEAQLDEIKNLEGIELVLGEHRDRDFVKTDMVIRNPAVPRDSKYLQIARQSGVPVEMDSSLFMQLHKGEVIGVTGSKGKSTTTSVIATILKIPAVGIEGTSPLNVLIDNPAQVVFELSSWRLEALNDKKISPPIAVMTSLYQDHLNTYESFDEYEEVKKTIVRYQAKNDIAILNSDDEKLLEWKKEIKGKLYWYGLEKRQGNGIYVRGDQIVIRIDGKEEQILARDSVPFNYGHELRNVLPGLLIAYLKGIDKKTINDRVAQLTTLPHRMELVRRLDGVEYINDSAATMPDATMAALQALKGKKIIHILGGNDKELEFEAWAEAESKANVSYLIWMPGNATGKMKELLAKTGEGQSFYDAGSMESAVTKAASIAKTGEVVLLSPGATSFSSFKNEFDRGDAFRNCVEAL